MKGFPKFTIEDTSEDHAILTNENGYDVAVLRRLEDVQDELDVESWNRLLAFLNAAPVMFDLFVEMVEGDDLRGLLKSIEKAKALLRPASQDPESEPTEPAYHWVVDHNNDDEIKAGPFEHRETAGEVRRRMEAAGSDAANERWNLWCIEGTKKEVGYE